MKPFENEIFVFIIDASLIRKDYKFNNLTKRFLIRFFINIYGILL